MSEEQNSNTHNTCKIDSEQSVTFECGGDEKLRIIASKPILRFCMEPGMEFLAPSKAHPDDAGYDIRAAEDCQVMPSDTAIVKTGLRMELPPGYEGQVRGRSGLAFKCGIEVFNSPGTIDYGYRGEVKVILHNVSCSVFFVRKGDRIAQLVIAKVPDLDTVVVSHLSESTTRGQNGFGSTGK